MIVNGFSKDKKKSIKNDGKLTELFSFPKTEVASSTKMAIYEYKYCKTKFKTIINITKNRYFLLHRHKFILFFTLSPSNHHIILDLSR